MRKIKSCVRAFMKYAFGYDTEYTKREMSLLTRVVAFFVVSFIGICLLSYFLVLKYHLSTKVVGLVLNNYTKVAIPCVSGYFVSWIGQMTKAFMSKQQYEANRTKLKLSNISTEEETED